MKHCKKLIEVALPLDAINQAAAREKSIRHGHPSTLHLWWARRPLAAARAVIFAQMVDDPSARPDLFPSEADQQRERERMFRLIEEMVRWENTTNEELLDQAREEIRESWQRCCADNAGHPQAEKLFNPTKLPAFHDPFAGGGALPLEAQRLGLEAHASDLNPVAVLINKAMIEIPPRFAGRAPVNPEARSDAESNKKSLIAREWNGTLGLAEDVRYYGRWMRDEAERRIGHLYPKVKVTEEMIRERPDLKLYQGRNLTVIAWVWARTVKSPNPAFADVEVPLISTYMLSTKKGREVYVEPVIEGRGYRFAVKVGAPKDVEASRSGTKLARGANFKCLMSGIPMAGDYVKAEANAQRMGVRLMAIVAEGDRGRVYLAPTPAHEEAARAAKPKWRPEVPISGSAQYLGIKPYGIDRFDQVFTERQLVAMNTFSNLVAAAREQVRRDATRVNWPEPEQPFRDGGVGASAYAEAVATYLSCGISRACDFWNSLATWEPSGGFVSHAFTRQAFPMVWDFAESNPFSDASGNWTSTSIDWIDKVISNTLPAAQTGYAVQSDAKRQSISSSKLVSTDPPYYDNIPYADLSDFFYVWLRRSLREVFPDLFTTLATPKTEELVAFAHRHQGKDRAEAFFLEGMSAAARCIAERMHISFPVTIYYAFKQSETKDETGTTSTGWEAFLDALIEAGFTMTGTWPVRTERGTRSRAIGSNALASSIVLVCRRRSDDAPLATRREFVAALKAELPPALAHLQAGNIAPVDLAQAAIGPGMAVYTRYASVLDAEGKPVPVRDALALINQILDETLAEQEGEFDADSRWALAWFEQQGFSEGEFGVAETLSKAKDTAIAGMTERGILASRAGKVRLLRPKELAEDWDPTAHSRLTVWEVVHQLVRVLERDGETQAAALLKRLGGVGETARELAYRLYSIAERKGRSAEALSYNALVQSWPEITRLARSPEQPDLL